MVSFILDIKIDYCALCSTALLSRVKDWNSGLDTCCLLSSESLQKFLMQTFSGISLWIHLPRTTECCHCRCVPLQCLRLQVQGPQARASAVPCTQLE